MMAYASFRPITPPPQEFIITPSSHHPITITPPLPSQKNHHFTTYTHQSDGRPSLEKINGEMALGFDDWDLDFYTDLFQKKVTIALTPSSLSLSPRSAPTLSSLSLTLTLTLTLRSCTART
jgi:hypothetical protein